VTLFQGGGIVHEGIIHVKEGIFSMRAQKRIFGGEVRFPLAQNPVSVPWIAFCGHRNAYPAAQIHF
jgi:hypothetical protein